MISEILRLRDEYNGVTFEYGDPHFSARATKTIEVRGFLGSPNSVTLISQGTIKFCRFACIAAPVIHIVAKEVFIGDATRFYAPVQLTICAERLVIGDMIVIEKPEVVCFSCETLTWHSSESFDIVKGWLLGRPVLN